MKKSLYHFTLEACVWLLALSHVFSACSARNEKNGEDYVLKERTHYYSPTTFADEIVKTPVPAPDVSGIWDVEDVDVSKLEKNVKFIAFTFDDAPTRNFPKLVKVFEEYNRDNPDRVASATVFYNGVNLNEYTLPFLLRARDAGLEAANHTYSHCDLRKLSPAELEREIDLVDEFLKRIDGKPRRLLRAPYGAVDEAVRAAAKTPLVDWSVDTLDWSGISVDEICEKTLSGLENGGIVLFHDGPTNTIEAVRRLLPTLKERGYQVTSVSQLSKINTCPLRTGGLYTRARPKK